MYRAIIIALIITIINAVVTGMNARKDFFLLVVIGRLETKSAPPHKKMSLDPTLISDVPLHQGKLLLRAVAEPGTQLRNWIYLRTTETKSRNFTMCLHQC